MNKLQERVVVGIMILCVVGIFITVFKLNFMNYQISKCHDLRINHITSISQEDKDMCEKHLFFLDDDLKLYNLIQQALNDNA